MDSVLTQVAQIATAADYEQKRLMATKAMHHKVINKDGPNLGIHVNIWWEWNVQLLLTYYLRSLLGRRGHPLLLGLVLGFPAQCRRL